MLPAVGRVGISEDDHFSTSTPPVRRCLWNLSKNVERQDKIPTFFEQDTFQQRVLIPKHKTFVCCRAVTLLEALKCLFMMLNCRFQLFDILRSSFTKCCLGLTIPLLSFLRCCINLNHGSLGNSQHSVIESIPAFYHLSSSVPELPPV